MTILWVHFQTSTNSTNRPTGTSGQSAFGSGLGGFGLGGLGGMDFGEFLYNVFTDSFKMFCSLFTSFR